MEFVAGSDFRVVDLEDNITYLQSSLRRRGSLVHLLEANTLSRADRLNTEKALFLLRESPRCHTRDTNRNRIFPDPRGG